MRWMMSRMTAPVGDVTTPMTRGMNGRSCLRVGFEKAFGGELALALFQQRHQRAGAGRFEIVDDDLVFRRARIGGQLAGWRSPPCLLRDGSFSLLIVPFQITASSRARSSFKGRNRHGPKNAARDSRKSRRARAHCRTILDRALQRAGNFAHGEFRGVGLRFGAGIRHGSIGPLQALKIKCAAVLSIVLCNGCIRTFGSTSAQRSH
jgi:hypothetical protein